jgi:universal stress protein A
MGGRRREVTNYTTILVAHDFSRSAGAALDHACGLAELTGAALHLVNVVEPVIAYPPVVGGIVPSAGYGTEMIVQSRRAAETSLAQIAAEVGPDCEYHIVTGSPATALCEAAEKLRADLIVMGTHGRTGLAHVLLGSVAERTLRRAPCPVLTVRAGLDDHEVGARLREA